MGFPEKEQDNHFGGWSAGTYRLLYPLRLREGAGLNYESRKREDLPEAVKKAMRCDDCVQAGSVVVISELKYLSVSVWGKTEDGWLCLIMGHTPYAKKLGAEGEAIPPAH